MDQVLTENGYRVQGVDTLQQARELIYEQAFDAIFVDIFLGEHDTGLSLLPEIHEHQPNTPIIVISGMAGMEHVMEALKMGAYDMLLKPFNIVDLINVASRAVDKKRMADENDRLLEELRHERDTLEEKVHAATRDLEATIGTLRQLNEQVAAMFEFNQTRPSGSLEELMEQLFRLLGRMINFDGAFCVVYDIRAQAINLHYTEGESVASLSAGMEQLLSQHAPQLVALVEKDDSPSLSRLQEAVLDFYHAELPNDEMMFMPLHVHQTLLGVVGFHRVSRSANQRLSESEERMLALAISHMLAALEQRNYIARTAQLAGLGELIAEIAHDLRHPMTSLRGAARMLIDGWAVAEKRERCLESIGSDLSRMESMVSELVNFYNPREMNMVAIDIHELLEKVLQVSGGLIEAKGIKVEKDFAAGQPQVLGLTHNLIEAFVNLVSNACQAMDSEGRLRLATRKRLSRIHQDRLREKGLQPGAYLVIEVEDDGCGIPPENMDRVFKRFFTTRAEGHGLGLAAVMRIIKKNLGHIHLESEPGKGTRFTVYLPKT